MPLVRLSSIGENISASPTTSQLRLALSFKQPHRPARLLDQSPPNMELPKEDSNGSSSGHDSRTGTSSKPRSRSLSIRGSNPLDCPLTPSDLELAALRKQILNNQEKETAIDNALDASPLPTGREYPSAPRATRSTRPPLPTPLESPSTRRALPPSCQSPSTSRATQSNRRPLPPLPQSPSTEKKSEIYQFIEDKKDSHKARFEKHRARFEKFESAKPSTKAEKREELVAKMNYQNYIDSPGGGPSANPRQAPPSPSQGMNHPNGMNGGGGMGMGGMVGYPTPAGHQSDLNYIMSMVEDLSAVLRQNQLLTASVVEKVGKVREKASTMNLTNDELIAAVASELNGKS
jgi:hypothetical protein